MNLGVQDSPLASLRAGLGSCPHMSHVRWINKGTARAKCVGVKKRD